MTQPWFSSVRAIFFDAVGTVIHPVPTAAEAYATIGARFGSRLDRAIVASLFRASFAAEEQRDVLNDLRTDEEREVQRWQYIVRQTLPDVTDFAGCFQALYQHFAQPAAWRTDPEAADTLKELQRRGYQLGLCSNFDSRLRSVLDGLPELEPLRHVMISSEVGCRKPAEPFFRKLQDCVGLPPQQILVVGDDFANDYQGARDAGLRATLFDPGQKHTACAAEHRISRLCELLHSVATRRGRE